jgi:Cop9 signalosome subunit 5 C-terminal domain
MIDLASKIQRTTNTSYSTSTPDLDGIVMTPTKPRAGRGRRPESGKFDKIIADSERISSEEVHGLLTQILKDQLFNGVRYVKGGQMGRLDEKQDDMEVVDSN